MVTEDAITSLPEPVILDQTGGWPVNPYTENVPKPADKGLWSMADKNNEICGISSSATFLKIDLTYLNRLQNEGFLKVKKAKEPLNEEGDK